jgi:nitroreductase
MKNTGFTLEKMRSRYATKLFDPAFQIDEEDESEILEVLNLTPTSMGIQPFHAFVVKDKNIRASLQIAANNQAQVTTASMFIVLAAGDVLEHSWTGRFSELAVTERKIEPERAEAYMNGFRSRMALQSKDFRQEWAARQTYIALGNLLTFCAFKGLDSCPMEGFSAEKFDEILGLNKRGLKSIVAIAIGKRSENDKNQFLPKIRRPLNEIVEIV